MAKSNFIVRGGGDFSGLYNEFNKAQKRMNAFKATMTKTMKTLGIALSGLAIGKVVKDSLNAASELEGAFVGLESILTGQGRSFEKAKSFINDYIKDGLIPLTDAITAYKNLAARGYNDEQIQTVLERLKDAAAFGRQSSYTLGEAVRSATEGLKNENSILVDNAGVTKNVSKMWEEYAKSIGKTKNQLTQQEKIQAEVNGIIKETQWQVGDAEKYADTYAGRLAALSKVLRDIKINLGQAFMPIANIVLPLLQTLANGLSKVTAFMAQFSQALFGKASISKQTKGVQQQANAVEELGDATEEAGKKAKGAVAGFDEINQLSMNEGGAGTEIGVGGVTDIGVEQIDDGTGGAFEQVSTKAQEMAEKVKTAFTNMKNAIVENKNIIVPAIGAILGAIIGLATYTGITALIKTIKDFGAAIKGAWAFLMAHPIFLVVAAIGALIGALIGAYKANDKFRETIDNLWAKIKNALGPVFEKLGEIMTWVWQNVVVPFANFLGSLFVQSLDACRKAAIWLYENAIKPLGDFLLWLWNTVLVPVGRVLIDILAVAFDVVASAAKLLWQNVLVPIGDFLGSIFIAVIKGVIEILQSLGNYILTIFKPIIEALSTVFMFLWQNVLKPLVEFLAGIFKNTIETATKTIGDIIINLKSIFVGLIDFIVGTFTGNWKRAWEGVKNIFSGIIGTLETIFKGAINGIIGIANKFIGFWNSIELKVPKIEIPFLGTFGGFTIGLPKIPEIPMLAKGGITDVNNPFLAVVGDNKTQREVIAPLDDLTDIIASAVGSAVLSAMQVNNGSTDKGDIILQIDGTTFARIISPYIDREKNRIGNSLIIQGI